MKQIKTLLDLVQTLPDKKSCREFLEEQRWHGKPICPHCHTESPDHYRLKSNGEFNGLYKCKHCRKRFTVTVGTMFEGSNVPLDKWFGAIYIFLSHKKGISSTQLAKDIGVTQKTAWFILGRIRRNLKDKVGVQFDDMTQIDETYVGGKNKGRVKHNRGRSLKTKIPVVGFISDGMVRTFVVPNTKAEILKPLVRALVKKGSTIITDGYCSYKGLSKEYIHKIVDHGSGEYVRDSFHTNTIEGFWSQFKRGIIGIYHRVSHKHLDEYCAEFDFRYNTRTMSDMMRFLMFIISAYRRVRYGELTYPFAY